MNIFIAKNGNRQGPYSSEQLKELVGRGDISLSDKAWHEGCTEWIRISDMPELVNAILPPMPGEQKPPEIKCVSEPEQSPPIPGARLNQNIGQSIVKPTKVQFILRRFIPREGSKKIVAGIAWLSTCVKRIINRSIGQRTSSVVSRSPASPIPSGASKEIVSAAPQPPVAQPDDLGDSRNLPDWYYLIAAKTCGPNTTEEIQNLLSSGAIPASTYVFREGMKDWAKADSLQEFDVHASLATNDPGQQITTPTIGEELKTSCQHCGGHIGFTSEYLGKTIACPHCSRQIVLDNHALLAPNEPKFPSTKGRPPHSLRARLGESGHL